MAKNDEPAVIQVAVEGKTRTADGEIIIEPNSKIRIVSIDKK